MQRLRKLLVILGSGHGPWIRALIRGTPAGVEHGSVLNSIDCRTVVDVGANRGQFALAARRRWPTATVISFEPLEGPAAKFRRVFANDRLVTLHVAAIGPTAESATMHLSKRDDSSSLLAITALQDEVFPGTKEVGTTRVRVAPLTDFLSKDAIVGPALLKIDVQGYELNVLRGCEPLLPTFFAIYCECSFLELYAGQDPAAAVVDWLARRNYVLTGVYNASYDVNGRAVQADFLFERSLAEPIPPLSVDVGS
nr:FkbM family methyltransferase [Mycobacterium sp. Root135]